MITHRAMARSLPAQESQVETRVNKKQKDAAKQRESVVQEHGFAVACSFTISAI